MKRTEIRMSIGRGGKDNWGLTRIVMKFRWTGFIGWLALAYCWLPSGIALAEDGLRFVTLEFAPFIYGESQRVAGPGKDIIAAACEDAGINCSFDIYPWRRAQNLIKDGAADGMMVIGRNPKREEWLRFSPPIFRTEYGFFVPVENELDYRTPGNIQSYRVGVFAPSNTATNLESIQTTMASDGFEPIDIDHHPDDAAGFRKLAAGRVDAVYSNRDRGWEIITDQNLKDDIRYAGPEKAVLYYAGITKDYPNQAVVDRFFDGLRALYASGRAQEIIGQYGLEPARH